LYGPRDDFDPLTSHVIPGIISKIHDAKKNNSNSITLWGDGTPTRDFLYVEDAARGIVLAAEKYDDFLPINLGTEEEISIKQLAKLISELMKFDGEITWDTSKPNGQPRRCVSNKKAREKLNFKPEISLTEGLRRTIEWYTTQ
jgi:GDP-L-fucose synthase